MLLDGLLRVSFSTAVLIICGIMAVGALVMFAMKKMESKKAFTYAGICVGAIAVAQLPVVKNLFSMVSVPMVTFFVVGLLCIFNNALMKTKIGQQFRAVGQNRTVANASGINVDRVRVIAIVISTVLAGWGQLIFVQNMGSFQTYGAHEQVGLYAGAAILVGGASIKKATNGQALLGCILFHLLFIVAPSAGKNLFGDAAIGEYFRVFISYGVITVALIMYENEKTKSVRARLVRCCSLHRVRRGRIESETYHSIQNRSNPTPAHYRRYYDGHWPRTYGVYR